jgi:hypothetical protein
VLRLYGTNFDLRTRSTYTVYAFPVHTIESKSPDFIEQLVALASSKLRVPTSPHSVTHHSASMIHVASPSSTNQPSHWMQLGRTRYVGPVDDHHIRHWNRSTRHIPWTASLRCLVLQHCHILMDSQPEIGPTSWPQGPQLDSFELIPDMNYATACSCVSSIPSFSMDMLSFFIRFFPNVSLIHLYF